MFTNYLGTYTFESMNDYEAGNPRSYTRLIGDPLVRYSNVLGGIYFQDDIRVRKNLTFSPGVRYELQTHLTDFNNFAPRFGVNWAPFKSGRTTIRASAGIFYDWFSTGTYEQTLRVDGFRQRELNIIDPAYPDPGSEGFVPATNRYRWVMIWTWSARFGTASAFNRRSRPASVAAPPTRTRTATACCVP